MSVAGLWCKTREWPRRSRAPFKPPELLPLLRRVGLVLPALPGVCRRGGEEEPCEQHHVLGRLSPENASVARGSLAPGGPPRLSKQHSRERLRDRRFYAAAAVRKPGERYALGLVLWGARLPDGRAGAAPPGNAQPSTRQVPRGRCRALYAPRPRSVRFELSSELTY